MITCIDKKDNKVVDLNGAKLVAYCFRNEWGR